MREIGKLHSHVITSSYVYHTSPVMFIVDKGLCLEFGLGLIKFLSEFNNKRSLIIKTPH